MSGRYGDVSGTYADNADCYCVPAATEPRPPGWVGALEKINACMIEALNIASEVTGPVPTDEDKSLAANCAADAMDSMIRAMGRSAEALRERMVYIKDRF